MNERIDPTSNEAQQIFNLLEIYKSRATSALDGATRSLMFVAHAEGGREAEVVMGNAIAAVSARHAVNCLFNVAAMLAFTSGNSPEEAERKVSQQTLDAIQPAFDSMIEMIKTADVRAGTQSVLDILHKMDGKTTQ